MSALSFRGGYACMALASCAAAAQDTTDAIPTVMVFGQGQTRQVQNITRDDLAKALPGASPLKTLEKLPGVSFQAADAFGSYEWSTRFSIRGFSQGQLGFTLDDVPLGNMSYGNNNGLHISRAISAENLGQVNLSQGAGAVGTPSTSNLGGTVQFRSGDPAESAGLAVAQTVGSHRSRRSFVRLDTGSVAGASAYLSLTRQRADKWKGEGPQDLDQFNSKLVVRFGGGRLSAFYNYSDRSENDYQDLSLDMVRRLGWMWDNYAPDWQRAVDAANGRFTGAVDKLDDAYYTARGLRKDHLAGASAEFDNGGRITGKATAYHHGNRGQGHWYTPYQASSPALPISIRTTEYAIDRDGASANLDARWGSHTVNAGLWVERNLHQLTRNFYAVTGPQDSNFFLSDPMLTGFQQDFRVRTRQFHLQDTWRVGDALRVDAGFKSTRVTIATTSINADRAAGTLKAAKRFLPQVGASLDLGAHDEVFASVARTLRAFEPGVYGQFSQNQAAFDANGARLRPETAQTADLGYRFQRATVSGSIAAYSARFNDRLLSVATCAGVVGCPNTVVNVGKVATRGLEAAAAWGLARYWSWFNSFTYNDSRYRSDYLDKGELVPVSGKRVLDAPRVMAHTELGYDDKTWFARTSAKYTARRFYAYLNDGKVPSYWVVNLAAGFRPAAFAGVKDLSIELHANNLLDQRYFGTIGSNQFVASDAQGAFPTLLTGAPRELFLAIKGKL